MVEKQQDEADLKERLATDDTLTLSASAVQKTFGEALARIEELEGQLSDCEDANCERKATIATLEAENKRLREKRRYYADGQDGEAD
jgi:hypothetical protein